ncbi:MAG: DUF935 family protein [Bacteroidales bacterium]|nr:DUF935 family protein [Bacteroidales bacterium]
MAKKNKNKTGTPSREKFIATVIKGRTPIVHRKDISDWQRAKQAAIRVDNPRFSQLQELFDYIMDDAHLSSQVLLRKSMPLGSEYDLVRENGDTDDQATYNLTVMPSTRRLLNAILDAQLYGYSLVELDPRPGNPDPLGITLIDRRHIDPRNGLVLIDTSDTTGIPYRELREFGTYILEFRGEGLGLLDKAVPHVLFKRFAQSCWSEFCEVCGMPPRVIKTNTQDPNLRDKYLEMLSNYGSGANGVIDIDDEMIFVATNASNGEAYENLIRLCSNELSLLINGAVLGQDTRYGSNSKEETSANLNAKLIKFDFDYIEANFNTIVIPALVTLGIIPQGLRFRFRQQEDTSELFNQTMQAAQYFDIDPEWVKEKFGIEVLGPRTMVGGLGAPADNDGNGQKSKQNKKQAPQGKDNDEGEESPRGDNKTRQNAYSTDYDPFV